MDRFYKYTTAEAALKILESCSVRYSCPTKFDDEMDVQAALHLDFDPTSFSENFAERFESLVLGKERPQTDPNHALGDTVLALWGLPLIQKKIRVRLAAPKLSTVCYSAIQNLKNQYLKMWKELFLPRVRIFCVSEEPHNPTLWSLYGDGRKGAMFVLKVLPKIDNHLCAAKPVAYRNEPFSFYSEEEWLDDTLGLARISAEISYYEYPFLKTQKWADQKEWRVFDLLVEPQSPLFLDRRIDKSEIEAIHLGSRMDPAIKRRIYELVDSAYPHAKVVKGASERGIGKEF